MTHTELSERYAVLIKEKLANVHIASNPDNSSDDVISARKEINRINHDIAYVLSVKP